MEGVVMTLEEVEKNYVGACTAMQVSVGKILGRSADDPEVIDLCHSMLLVVRWQQEYSMKLAMEMVQKGMVKV
jgi:hypothetical protein